MARIMIDPGHGPTCPNHGPTGYREVVGAWSISCYLKAALERAGHTVDFTRAENEDPLLSVRGKRAQGYDLFISIHSNGSGGQAKGVEVYYSVRQLGNRAFAAEISAEVATVMGTFNRGAKTRESTNSKGYDWLTVMFYAERVGCPKVFLCEGGFHDNAEDEAFLKTESGRKAIAEAQAKVICRYLGGNYTADVAPVVETPEPAPVEPVDADVNVTYRARTQRHGWLGQIRNIGDGSTGYAGWPGEVFTGLAVKVDHGSLWYQVHLLGGNWLGQIRGYDVNDIVKGYAGNGRPIDAIRVYYETPTGEKSKRAKYRVAVMGRNYYGWQYDTETSDGQDGYAGCFGKAITKLQLEIE